MKEFKNTAKLVNNLARATQPKSEFRVPQKKPKKGEQLL